MKLSVARQIVVVTCLLHFASALAGAKEGKLLVLVQDLQQRPISRLKVGIEGGGDYQTTGEDGKVVLTLAGKTKENDWVSFQIIKCPPGQDLVIVAPANHRHPVPSFDDKAENFVTIIVVPRAVFTALIALPKMREVSPRIKSKGGQP